MRTRGEFLPLLRLISSSHSRNIRKAFVFPIRNQAGYARQSTLQSNARNIPLRNRHDHDATIYALSTAPGRAAIAIIRISGPAWLEIYQGLCPGKAEPKPRHATLRTLYDATPDPCAKRIIDPNALILYFPAPETVTGEPVLELHVHGGTAVVKAVLATISKCLPTGSQHTIRYAEPGEFTRRAFYNNRLNLLQVEALGDTLAADTEQQRQLAVKGTTNTLGERYESWRQQLLYARGELEALIDFAEDQQFDESPAQLCASVAGQVQNLLTRLKANIENASRGELLRNGINIALVGEPNAGKSSLLNQIVGREAAIVSTQAGTTRDVIDVNVDIGGFYCRFGDLAGLRQGSTSAGAERIGEVEQEGIRRAKERALSADVVLVVLAPSTVPGHGSRIEINSELYETIKSCDPEKQKLIFIVNKADLFTDDSSVSQILTNLENDPNLSKHKTESEAIIHAISCTDAERTDSSDRDPGGIQLLLKRLTTIFTEMTSATMPGGQVAPANNSAWAESLGATERQRLLLQQCVDHLNGFLAQTVFSTDREDIADIEEFELDIVLAAESLRAAAECLAKITGKGESGDVEEVLGVVFEKYENHVAAKLIVIDLFYRFCVGK